MAVIFYPHHPHKDKSNIDIIVSFRAKRFKRSTGIVVPLSQWLQSTQKCSESVDRFPDGITYNKVLKRQREAAEKAIIQFIGEMIVPTPVQFWNLVDEFLHGEKRSVGGFTAYFEDCLSKRTNTTAKTYRSQLRLIQRFEQQTGRVLMFKDIDQHFYDSFRRWLFTQHKDDGGLYSDNYFGRIIKTVKVIFNDARYNGVHRLDTPANFKADDYVADTVYLTTQELDAMMAVELKSPTDILARAKFIIGACTGLRISDFNHLNDINIGDRYLNVTAKKTGQRIIAPLNSRARDLIESVDVFAPLTDQEINRSIKEIARAAGIIEPVEVVKHIAGRRVHEVFDKCDLISSHTARRSFATNAYKAGVPTISIMKITGHTTEKSFLRYIKISKEENAELMAEHPFFK